MTSPLLDYVATRIAVILLIPYFVCRNLRFRWLYHRLNRRSKASDPGLVRLSHEKLARFCPELYPTWGDDLIARWDGILGVRAMRIFMLADHLKHGDSRAAVVVSVSPLLVAAYTDEMDCVVVLRFPAEFVAEFGLEVRSRLLTVNRYFADVPLATDLTEGPLTYHRCDNFMPLIADFLTDDADRLRARKAKIRLDEWSRTWVLGLRRLEEHGLLARDGHPDRCDEPADFRKPDAHDSEHS